MSKIGLITDTGCDLPDEVVTGHNIAIVPLYILWGQQELRDRIDIRPNAFYKRLLTDPVHPTTSQPHPADFKAAIERVLDHGAEQVVVMTISSGMSSTYDSAQIAAKMFEQPVYVFDTRANSLTQGYQVLAAARVRAAGGSVEDIIAAVDRVRQRSVTLLHVDTLEYLYRGGRIGRASKWLGTILNLKPQLYVDHKTGRIEPGTRSRSRTQALRKLYANFFKQLDTSKPLHIGIVHSESSEDAEALAEQIRQEYNPVELMIGMTSPMMGVHTGPGAMALCGYAEV